MANSVTYATAPALGTSATFLQSDAVLKFPTSLMSSANSATLTFTDDATSSYLANSLGVLFIRTKAGMRIDNLGGTSTNSLVSIVLDPDDGNRTGIVSQWSTGATALTSQTLNCWDATFTNFAVSITGCTLVGFDTGTLSFSPGAGSDTTNKAYGVRTQGPDIRNATGGWTEVAGAYIQGPRRFISNPTVTLGCGVIIEPSVISATQQIGVYIRQRTAQQVATTRYGIKIDAQNSGTTKYAIYAPTDQSTFGPVNIDGGTITDATDIALGSTTGTKIGTATTQKLGFFNAVPVTQPGTYAITNGTIDRTVDADSTSLNELADVVYTMWFDLNSLGLLG